LLEVDFSENFRVVGNLEIVALSKVVLDLFPWLVVCEVAIHVDEVAVVGGWLRGEGQLLAVELVPDEQHTFGA